MADQKIRSFLAIQLDDPLTKEINNFVTKIQPRFSQFRFVPPTNWHLTLHFFGSISAGELNLLRRTLPQTISKIESFSVSIKGLGGFPNDRKSRILWIGVEKGSERLVFLKKILDQNLSQIKFPLETKSYHPHITIARSQKLVNCSILDSEKWMMFNTQSKIEKISLFQSNLTPSGPKHTILENFHLVPSK